MKNLLFALAVLCLLSFASSAQAGEVVCNGKTCRLVDRPVVKVVTAPIRVVKHAACNVVENVAERRCCRVQQRQCVVKQRKCRLFRRLRCCR